MTAEPVGDRLAVLLAGIAEADTAIAHAQLTELADARRTVQRDLAELMAAPADEALDRPIVKAGLRRRLRALDEAEDGIRRQLRYLRRRFGQQAGVIDGTGSLWDPD